MVFKLLLTFIVLVVVSSIGAAAWENKADCEEAHEVAIVIFGLSCVGIIGSVIALIWGY